MLRSLTQISLLCVLWQMSCQLLFAYFNIGNNRNILAYYFILRKFKMELRRKNGECFVNDRTCQKLIARSWAEKCFTIRINYLWIINVLRLSSEYQNLELIINWHHLIYVNLFDVWLPNKFYAVYRFSQLYSIWIHLNLTFLK